MVQPSMARQLPLISSRYCRSISVLRHANSQSANPLSTRFFELVLHLTVVFPLLVAGILLSLATFAVGEDPYETYINTSLDFQAVKQDKDWLYEAFPSWTYMPWTYRWNSGYTEESGQWSKEHGYNGAFLDNGQTRVGGVDKLAWINEHQLRFYMDHTASKGYLHLWDNSSQADFAQLHGTGVRTVPVNEELKSLLKRLMGNRINNVKSSPYRAAYALDDEISWGHFVHPTMWQITDQAGAYDTWLQEIYGPDAPTYTGWISYDNIRSFLPTWKVSNFDASQLMDQWTFNDSHWNNFLGDLVESANVVDPHTPTGIVGAQTPNAFGGYDYAKLMKKVQYIEAYDNGQSNSIIRSLNPHNAIPSVTSQFYSSAKKAIWENWYYLAHGNRGHIGWVDNWFDGSTPKDWHDEVAPHYLEAGETIGPLLAEAEWKHDGIALLYNHASIQMSWILDAQAHGSTWVNRNGDSNIGSSHLVKKAWENMLRDEGLQYSYVAYDDVIRNGISDEYQVLILPAAISLSDAEAKRIREFVEAGGTVIADYMPGLWDQHGKGRSDGGVLDDLFGVAHDPNMTSRDVFGTNNQWAEVDQDVNYSNYNDYELFMTNGNTSILDPSGFYKAVRDLPTMNVQSYGKGKAVLMNLSPQWYNAYRQEGNAEAEAARDVFMDILHDAGIERWVEIENAGQAEQGYEITYWTKDDRTIMMLVMNPVNDAADNMLPITLAFRDEMKDVRNERTGALLGDGNRFNFDWTVNEAIVLSFANRNVPEPATTSMLMLLTPALLHRRRT